MDNLTEQARKLLAPESLTANELVIHHCPEIEATGDVSAFFTEGQYLWTCYDDEAKRPILERNVALLSRTIGVPAQDMVRASQSHTDIIRTITREQAGEGMTRLHTVGPYDALITDVRGLLLCTAEADCLPVYLFDPVHQAIAMVHSGWRGTAQLIAPKTIARMEEVYGTDAADLVVCFGPSICGACYEVGAELAEEFTKGYSAEERADFFEPLEGGKFLLDNAAAVRLALERSGVPSERITDCGICTYEDERFASYRLNTVSDPHMLTAIMLKP